MEAQGNAPKSFLEIEKLFINQYTLWDDKNIAQDKSHVLQQCGSVHEYITAFNNVMGMLLGLAKDYTIHTFAYGLKPHLKGYVKA